jgi:hypothetical protein
MTLVARTVPTKKLWFTARGHPRGLLLISLLGPATSTGSPVILLHSWPYDVYNFADVATKIEGIGIRPIIFSVNIATILVARPCATAPSSSGWSHGYCVDWKDQTVVNGQNPR